MEVADENDGALAARIAFAATMHSFVCTHETSHVVRINMAHRVLNSSLLKKMGTLPNKSAPGRGERLNS